jgi:Mrp family chromosome partitioning ATPase
MTEQHELVRGRMRKVQHKIAVISGKGGVGKTVVTVNLAMAFAKHGISGRVGILDADIHDPCVPKMLGLKGSESSGWPTRDILSNRSARDQGCVNGFSVAKSRESSDMAWSPEDGRDQTASLEYCLGRT